MHPDRIAGRPLRWIARFTVLALIGTFQAPAATAVEPGRLSVTAEGTTAARAIFHLHPDANIRNDDSMAMAMVHPDYWHYSIMSDDLEGALAVFRTYRMTTSFYVNARTKHIDGILKQAAGGGIEQVVNLGAGYDSRAYRFGSTMPGVRFFEVDLPGMIAEKKRRLKQILGAVPDDVIYVPIDFNTQTIPDELKNAGYDRHRKTLFIWEGVTMYISGDAVDSTLHFIRTRSAPGSSVVFDYMPLAVIQGKFDAYKDVRGLAIWVAYKGEPFVFGIPEGSSRSFVEERGLTVLSDLGPRELEARYLTLSSGKLVGRSSSGFRVMHAAVPPR